jgi:hypothetical protein
MHFERRTRSAGVASAAIQIRENGPFSCRITNARGATVMRFSGHGPSRAHIPTRKLPAGVYSAILYLPAKTLKMRFSIF